MTAGRYVFVLLAVPALMLAVVGTFNFVVDPLQYFRRATFYAPHFSDNQRYQNPGIIRNFDYGTIVLGTSHAENFLPSDIARELGEPAAKLAIAGSHVAEQAATLALALRQGHVHRVLWQLDFASFTLPAATNARAGNFPAHLYGTTLGAVVPYLFSLDTAMLGLEALARPPAHASLDALNAWWNVYRFGPDRVAGDWDYMRGRWTPVLRGFWLRQRATTGEMREMFDTYVLAAIAEHPGVHFDLILVPQTFLDFANDLLIDDARLYDRLRFAEMVRAAGRAYPNATVWDFQAPATYGDRFEHFKDLAHFDREVNLWMLRTIASGRLPQAPPDAWVGPLLAYLASTCDARGKVDGAICTPELACARERLRRWVAAAPGERGAIEREKPCLAMR